MNYENDRRRQYRRPVRYWNGSCSKVVRRWKGYTFVHCFSEKATKREQKGDKDSAERGERISLIAL